MTRHTHTNYMVSHTHIERDITHARQSHHVTHAHKPYDMAHTHINHMKWHIHVKHTGLQLVDYILSSWHHTHTYEPHTITHTHATHDFTHTRNTWLHTHTRTTSHHTRTWTIWYDTHTRSKFDCNASTATATRLDCVWCIWNHMTPCYHVVRVCVCCHVYDSNASSVRLLWHHNASTVCGVYDMCDMTHLRLLQPQRVYYDTTTRLLCVVVVFDCNASAATATRHIHHTQ